MTEPQDTTPVKPENSAEGKQPPRRPHFQQNRPRNTTPHPHFENDAEDSASFPIIPDRSERASHQVNRYAPRPPLGRKPQQPPPDERQQKKKGRQPFDGKDHLYEIVKVRLARSQRLIEVNTNEKPFEPNTRVLVRIHRNVLLATTVGYRYRRVAEINSLPYIMREATEEDIRIDTDNIAIEKHAQELATKFAIDNNLQMKVLSADLSHDHKNITINFASDVRVDFREMVAFLAGQLKLRVEMYQLGLRNGTGLICALGSCGERLCCGRFLGQFDPVAIKLLRAQGLATNPKRISGVCGRLYCCLSYEYCDYLKEKRSLPKKGKRVMTRWGLGRITDTDPLREEVVISYDNGEFQRLTHSDFVAATDDIVARVEAEEIVFPLEPQRFYLNNDPAHAVENTLHTKAPEAAPAKPHARHTTPAPVVTNATTKKSTLERHKPVGNVAVKAVTTKPVAPKPQPPHAEKLPVPHPVKRHRAKSILPSEYTTNAEGLVILRKRTDDATPAKPEPTRTVTQKSEPMRTVVPRQNSSDTTSSKPETAPVAALNVGSDTRTIRKARPRRSEEESFEARNIEEQARQAIMDPMIFQPPRTSNPHPLPQNASHPGNPRRRRPHPRNPLPPDSH